MLELARLLALLAFVALAIALLLFLRRAGQLLAETRERERFRKQVADLVERVGASLDGVSGRIDAVRRRTVAAEAIGANLSAAAEAIGRYTDEARALPGTGAAAEIRDGILAELDRAARGLAMVRHGCTTLATVGPGGPETEAQTSIKRGYLSLLHAREAIGRHGARVAELAKADRPGLFQRRQA